MKYGSTEYKSKFHELPKLLPEYKFLLKIVCSAAICLSNKEVRFPKDGMSAAAPKGSATVRIRVIYGKDPKTPNYRRCFETLKKDLESMYESSVLVTGKRSDDRDDCFDVALREGEGGELKTIYTKEKYGLVDSDEKFNKISAQVEKHFAKMESEQKKYSAKKGLKI